MIEHYQIFRDATGRLQMTASPAGDPVVADFLVTDIREDRSHCDAVLDMIERGRNGGNADPESSTGNIYRLTVGRHRARLANIHDEQAPGADIACPDLLELLREWRRHL